MAVVTIEWNTRAAGRSKGDRETVELTDFVQGVITNGYVSVLVEHAPVVGVFQPVFEDAGSVQAVYEEAVSNEPTGDQPSSAERAADGTDEPVPSVAV